MAKIKIAIIHPKLGWGGSEVTVLWMMEALKNDYDISLITSGRVDIPRLNKYYGTSLDQKEFSIIQVSMPLGLEKTAKFAALRGRLIQRYCQKVVLQFDLMINVYSPCDFKTKGIQFATDIESLPAIIPVFNWKKIWYRNTLLRKIYLKICDWVSASNPEEWKKNITVSNSHWTAQLMLQKYGIESRILYPPVSRDFPSISYEKKENGFVLIGRIVPEKKIDMAIEILKKVRQDGCNTHLHIVGGAGNSRYARALKKLCSENKDWLFFEGRLSEEKKKELIANHLFGISCRKNEPFGIAVAEMVKAGCIVFVPDSGGQTEIVAHPNLIYASVEDAAQKIEAIIKNEKLQNELHGHLLATAQKFSAENFKKEIKGIIKSII